MSCGYLLRLLRSWWQVELDFFDRKTPLYDSCKPVACLAASLLVSMVLVTTGCGGISSSAKSVAAPPGNYPIPNPGLTGSFFGINTNSLDDPWPGTIIPLASWRSHDSNLKWADLNTGPGVYDFSKLDQWLSNAKATNTDVLYTMYATPPWISSRGVNSSSPDTSCAYATQIGPGICDPPVDLSCDGTGTNQTFKDFVTALIQHVGPGAIQYWEMWNEPNASIHWNATADCPNTPFAADLMLARMARDMKAIVSATDAKAKFTTPPLGDDGQWLAHYFANTDGAQSEDIVAFHGYPSSNTCPGDCAEQIADQINQLKSRLPASELGKPLFDTEGNWGYVNKVNALTDPDHQASFVMRYYLIQMSKGVAKFYWYTWDISTLGALYDTSTASLTPAGNAYVQVVRWTNGGTATVGPCSANGTVWTCTLNSPRGAQAEAIWDSSQTCSGGVCSTTDLSVPSQFNAYLDLSGNTTNLSGSSVPVGLKPVLLITQ